MWMWMWMGENKKNRMLATVSYYVSKTANLCPCVDWWIFELTWAYKHIVIWFSATAFPIRFAMALHANKATFNGISIRIHYLTSCQLPVSSFIFFFYFFSFYGRALTIGMHCGMQNLSFVFNWELNLSFFLVLIWIGIKHWSNHKIFHASDATGFWFSELHCQNWVVFFFRYEQK